MKDGRLRFWLGGTAVSIIGIVLARIVAPEFSGRPALLAAAYLSGVTLGIAGLVIITFGTGQGRKRKDAGGAGDS